MDNIGITSIVDDGTIQLPTGSYLVFARFTSKNHVQDAPYNLRAMVGGSEIYTAYHAGGTAYTTIETVFGFTGNNLCIQLYQNAGKVLNNITGRATSVEIIRLL